jgi:hypothetical protein
MTETRALGRARWWMRRRWFPRTFAEHMATPAKITQRDRMLAMCDAYLAHELPPSPARPRGTAPGP